MYSIPSEVLCEERRPKCQLHVSWRPVSLELPQRESRESLSKEFTKTRVRGIIFSSTKTDSFRTLIHGGTWDCTIEHV